jgi:hypothetical protein
MTRPDQELRDAALAYASRGIPVLPLHYPVARAQAARPVPADLAAGWALGCWCADRACGQVGKHPLGALVPHGLHEATTNRARVLAWWTQHPQANIGLATGHRFDVLDLDGPAAIHALRRFAAEYEMPLPARGPVVRSGRAEEGWHYYLAPAGLPRRQRARRGGLPGAGRLRRRPTQPPRHREALRLGAEPRPSAAGPARRAVPTADRARPARPLDARAAARAARRPRRPLGPQRVGPRAAPPRHRPSTRARTARGAQHGAVGGARNLYNLVAAGALDEREVEQGLLDAAGRCGLLHDEPRQTHRTLASARQVGLAHPRRPPVRPAPERRSAPSPAAREAGARTPTRERR